jgi:hypothetical protein
MDMKVTPKSKLHLQLHVVTLNGHGGYTKSKLHLRLHAVTLNGHGGYTKEQITLATTFNATNLYSFRMDQENIFPKQQY